MDMGEHVKTSACVRLAHGPCRNAHMCIHTCVRCACTCAYTNLHTHMYAHIQSIVHVRAPVVPRICIYTESGDDHMWLIAVATQCLNDMMTIDEACNVLTKHLV